MAPTLVSALLLGLLAAGRTLADVEPYDDDPAYQDQAYGLYPVQYYQTSEEIASPIFNVLHEQEDDVSNSSYIFMAPRAGAVFAPAPMIIDAETLDLVWFGEGYGEVFDVRVQQYDDEDYITFWVGEILGGHGRGHYLMLNSSYDIAYNLSAVDVNVDGDFHEFQLTQEGTALVTVYEPIPYDLSDLDIEDGWIIDGVFQEIDIATNELIFMWRASDHFTMDDAFIPPQDTGQDEDNGFDFFHINSVEKDEAGNYLVSARHTHTVCYVDGSTGDVLWVLGGSRNEFDDLSGGNATNFSWQHDARWVDESDPTTFTLFDNHDNGHTDPDMPTRGLRITVDTDAMTAVVDETYMSPNGLISQSQGNLQLLDNGNVLMGYGSEPIFTEYSPDGAVLWDVQFGIMGNRSVNSYRVYKQDWTGRPSAAPVIAAGDGDNSSTDGMLFFSWNGATGIDAWALLAANESADALLNGTMWWKNVTSAGFETNVTVGDAARFVLAVPLDADGNVVGVATDAYDLDNGETVEVQGDVGSLSFASAADDDDDDDDDNDDDSDDSDSGSADDGDASSTTSSAPASTSSSAADGALAWNRESSWWMAVVAGAAGVAVL
ncbi:ASST-domain-containing protein [Lineolata rhizophorae]|uniref:ASST-domain-containing protein n=1 Tax=Lineolata rhizophorae TaxID=578093 RepID=A0A6A6NMV7_9PEZI|nr:ASST-domain-containing protein [Lineolata rhizophorae]